MSKYRYSPGMTPDDQLKEKARALQALKETNPEFKKKQHHLSIGTRTGTPQRSPPSPILPGYRLTWSQERNRLDKEKQKLQEEQERIKQASKRWSLPSPYEVLDPISRRPYSDDGKTRWEADIADFVLKTQEKIPDMILNLKEMKKQVQTQKTYIGDVLLSAPKTYKPWQMADYYMVRDLLMDLLDEVVEKSESKLKPKTFEDGVQQQTVLVAQRELDTAREKQSQERALQLIAEELVLEITFELVRWTVEEYLGQQQFANKLRQHLVMQSAEVVATGNPSGRPRDDPAYDLITSTYAQMCKDRNQNRQEIWAHSQQLHLHSDDTQEDEVINESAFPGGCTPLHLLNLPIKVGRPPAVPRGPDMKAFRELESNYWQQLSTESDSISLTKKVQGVVTAAMSPNQKYMALGCLRGDVFVYSYSQKNPIPVRTLQNENTQNDAVIDISWSVDSSRLITINETGILQLWSMSSGGVSEKDIKDLEIRPEAGLIKSSQLTHLLTLDADKSDFNFKEGPLHETGAQAAAVSPAMAVFHPSHTLLATQNFIVVGLQNGDILKCDTSVSANARELNLGTGNHIETEVERQRNFIGQEVQTELFRSHKSPLMFLGFLGNHGNMVSMDTSGLICVWESNRESWSHFGWFEPSTKYYLELAERVYSPRSDDEQKVHYSDKALAEKKVSRQERQAAREKATQRLENINMEVLWHREVDTKSGNELQVFCPRKVQDAGSIFHGVIRQSSTEQLLMHYTYYCKPAKNFCSQVLKVQQSACGTKLVFMILFPAFPPKGPHISFVALDISEMKVVRDTRIDLKLTEEEHNRCLNENVCSFGMTPIVGVTGTMYIIACVLGTVRVYSMETSFQIMSYAVEIHQGGSKLKKSLAERATVLVSMAKGHIGILTYTEKYNSVDILQFVDYSSVKLRRRVHEAYLDGKKQKPLVPYEQQHHHRVWTMDNDAHRNVELYMRRLVLQLSDIAVYVSEGLEIDKDRLQQFWNEDKISAESNLLQRILAQKKGISGNNDLSTRSSNSR
ncbi:uncharacterized protein [Asterias amurensis]|uniref:uncharacterized protein n=1 Tax=Asterias amurensis TaxID=7602 RepID=UPI003AB82B1C